MNFLNINYLKTGNQKQVKAYHILTQNKILSNIAEFTPTLVGTIPISIDIENSDLDIICYCKNKQDFIKKLDLNFRKEKQFSIQEVLIDNTETVIANFVIDDFKIEIFGQSIPIENQSAYKHMLIEYKILKAKGESFRLEIIKLKQNGYKTEPAFGLLLGLTENPYLELLAYDLEDQ